jgi:hypothetical protein
MSDDLDQKRRSKLLEAIERVQNGEMREYWLQIYIRDNYKKFGFDSISGPFDTGYDFKGVLKGKEVVVEAERLPQFFVKHGHDASKVDILIAMGDDDTPRELLPKKILFIDPEHLILETHEIRKDYAINAKAREKVEQEIFRRTLQQRCVARSLGTLVSLFYQEVYDGSPEDEEVFNDAMMATASLYMSHYDLWRFVESGEINRVSEIDYIAHRVFKDGEGSLTENEEEHMALWMGVAIEEYLDRLE